MQRLECRSCLLDTLTCPRCDASMLVLALISEPEVVRKILLHLGLPADLPTLAPALRCVELLFDDDCTSARPARRLPETSAEFGLRTTLSLPRRQRRAIRSAPGFSESEPRLACATQRDSESLGCAPQDQSHRIV